MITDHMVAADKALSYARKRVEMSVEAWLDQGPATGKHETKTMSFHWANTRKIIEL
jgi:hypothetical protein